MNEPLDLLWALFNHPEPVLRGCGWRSAAEDRLIAAKLLVPTGPASWVWCPECFDHEEEVVVVPGAGGQTRMFIPCPEHIRVEVRDRDRERWQVSPPWIAVIGQEVNKDQVARAVARSGGAAELMRSTDSDSVVRAGGNARDRRGNRLIGAIE